MRRFQECNWLVKVWRLRHYVYIPFKWLSITLTKPKDSNGEILWRLLIGVAQCDMNWTYSREEVEKYIRKKKNERNG